MAGFTDRRGPLSTGNPVRRLLKDLSNLGMAYDDMIIRNSRAVGFTENQMGYSFNPMGSDGDDMYGAFAALSLTDTNLNVISLRLITPEEYLSFGGLTVKNAHG